MYAPPDPILLLGIFHDSAAGKPTGTQLQLITERFRATCFEPAPERNAQNRTSVLNATAELSGRGLCVWSKSLESCPPERWCCQTRQSGSSWSLTVQGKSCAGYLGLAKQRRLGVPLVFQYSYYVSTQRSIF